MVDCARGPDDKTNPSPCPPQDPQQLLKVKLESKARR